MTRRGRPPLEPEDQTTTLQVRVPIRLFDRSCQAASAARLSVPDWIRKTLTRATNTAATDTRAG